MPRLILLLILPVGFSFCTNISFKQINFGPKGVDFTKGTFLVNDLHAPTSKEGNIKLTSITMQYLQEIGGDSVVHIESLRSADPACKKIPRDTATGFIDSLRKYTSHDYLVFVTIEARGENNDLYVSPSDFVDDLEGETYLDNHASAKILVIEIKTHKQIYEQETQATEFIDTEASSLDDNSSSHTTFTRSSENIMKNALVRGLKDLRKHSKRNVK